MLDFGLAKLMEAPQSHSRAGDTHGAHFSERNHGHPRIHESGAGRGADGRSS